MLGIVGGIGLGLVWGWLAVRLLRRARPALAARTLLGLALQALVVLWLAGPGGLAGFAGGLAAGAMLRRAWRRALEARYQG